MPNYKGHLFGGFIAFIVGCFLLFSTFPSLFKSIELLFFTLIGSLFPDIDTKSKGQQFFYRVVFVVFLFLLIKQQLMQMALLAIIICIPLMVKHRGLCHSLWFIIGVPMAIVCYVALWLPQYTMPIVWDALFFCIGALSHVWLDVGWRKMLRV